MARILIAEDDPRSAEKIESLLRSLSHMTVLARSGEEGLRHLREGLFDLVVTDLMMEKGTGFDVLEWIKTNMARVPVLICSSYARPDTLGPHLSGLRYRILKKPFGGDELGALVRELLAEEGEAPATPRP